ncbi:MAG: TolB family protein [Puniceicoccaceae bacterium]
MKPLKAVYLLTLSVMNIGYAVNMGDFDAAIDIGNPEIAGRSEFDPTNQTYELSGAGYNIWFDRDEFHYLYKELDGDFILTANFQLIGEGVNAHRKVGWMVRNSTAEDSPHFTAALHGDGLTTGQWRDAKGASMQAQSELKSPDSHCQILQIERKGREYIFRAARKGELLRTVGSTEMDSLQGPVLAGLYICSHDVNVMESVKVWNVRVDFPVADDYNPYSAGFLRSRLETMDVLTGERRVIWEHDDRFEAPNWTPDGSQLVFNMNGLLYKISVNGGEPVVMDTGTVDDVNNDHGISFDGKLMAISHRRELPDGKSGSAIYVVPLEGGEPRLVVEEMPSYWHGWHPDNERVVYVAKREKGVPFNIFEANINTGEEKQLTFFDANHVDGPEYGPAGEWLYYNGSQTGPMQIWRMREDGSTTEQLTFDELNDWFPHISPDGKWMVYISFPTTIRKDSHPPYKRVHLRLMNLETRESRVIAYLYGGQGTINVPSWSPDSRRIAFVSNEGGK